MNEVERAKASLAKMIPFDEWVRRNNPSADKIAMRNRVVAELEKAARGERLTEGFVYQARLSMTTRTKHRD